MIDADDSDHRGTAVVGKLSQAFRKDSRTVFQTCPPGHFASNARTLADYTVRWRLAPGTTAGGNYSP